MKPVKLIIPSKPKPDNPTTSLVLGGFLLCALAAPARAGGIVDVQNTVNSIATKVDSIKTSVSTSIPTAVSNVKSDTALMTGNLRNGLNLLVGDVNTLLSDAASDIGSKASAELAGRADFLNNPSNGPAQVRTNITSFLISLQTIENTLNGITGTNGKPLDLSLEIQLINAAPNAAMFPLSKAFQVIDFNKLTVQLSEAADNLQTLSAALSDEATDNPQKLNARSPSDPCAVIMANPTSFENAASKAAKIAVALKLSGGILEALAKKIPEAGIGIWGFPHVRFKENTASTIAKILDTIGDATEGVAKIVETRLHSCKMESNQTELLAQLSLVQTALTNLNTMISSAASQASVDALAASLGNVTAPLDVAVSTRASQASMDTLTSMAENQQTTMLRMQVELQLSDNTRQLSIFYLPEALGGKLGFVRSVVADTIATNEAADLYSGTLAGEKLQAGDDAAATNDFRDAFGNYRQAYQEVVKWPVTARLQSSAVPGTLDLSWPSDLGGIYAVQSSSDLVNWSILMPKVVGAAGQTAAALAASGDRGFYRVFRLSSYDPSANKQ